MSAVERGSLLAAILARTSEGVARIRTGCGKYRGGDFVFVRDVQGGKCTVEMPMTPGQIADQQSRGSLLRSYLTTINFPSSWLEVLIPENAES